MIGFSKGFDIIKTMSFAVVEFFVLWNINIVLTKRHTIFVT